MKRHSSGLFLGTYKNIKTESDASVSFDGHPLPTSGLRKGGILRYRNRGSVAAFVCGVSGDSLSLGVALDVLYNLFERQDVVLVICEKCLFQPFIGLPEP